MVRKKRRLIIKAIKTYKHIYPCGSKTFGECFMKIGKNLSFWYNDKDGSTHVVMQSRASA